MADMMLIPANLEQAAVQLARCKVAANVVGGFHKQANPSWWQDPALQQTLAPVAIGAGIGGLGGLALGARSKRKVNPLWTALSGATIGAGAGGLVSAIRNSGALTTPPELNPGSVDKRLAENTVAKVQGVAGPVGEVAARAPILGPIVRGTTEFVSGTNGIGLDLKGLPRPPGAGSLGAEAKQQALQAGAANAPELLGAGMAYRGMKKWHETKEDANSLLGYGTGKVVPNAAAKADFENYIASNAVLRNADRQQLRAGDVSDLPLRDADRLKFEQLYKAQNTPLREYKPNGGEPIHAPASADKLIGELQLLGRNKSILHPQNLPVARTAYQRAILNKHLNAARAAGQGQDAQLYALMRGNRALTSPLQRGVRAGGRTALSLGLSYWLGDKIREMRGIK